MCLKQSDDGVGRFANWRDYLHVRVHVGSVGAQPMRLLLRHLYDGLRMLVVLNNVPDLLYGTVVCLRFLSGRMMVGVAVIDLTVCFAPLFHETNVAQVVMMRHGQHQQHHEHCQPKTYYESFSPHHDAKVAKFCCNSVAKCSSICFFNCIDFGFQCRCACAPILYGYSSNVLIVSTLTVQPMVIQAGISGQRPNVGWVSLTRSHPIRTGPIIRISLTLTTAMDTDGTALKSIIYAVPKAPFATAFPQNRALLALRSQGNGCQQQTLT